MTKIAAIASGSNGNCYYIEHNNISILIDAGISRKQIVERMKKLDLDIKKVKGIFISHEHSDHIKGLEVLSKIYSIPVYFTKKTYENTKLKIEKNLLNFFSSDDNIIIEDITIKPFKKKHDAIDPCSFLINVGNKNIGILTDIGSVCENVIKNVHQCNILFLESNYDEKMLNDGKYPYFLKKRIQSDFGHLSNKEAAEIIINFASNNLTHIFLSHLSGENNCPIKAKEFFKSELESNNKSHINLIMTSRKEPSEVLIIN